MARVGRERNTDVPNCISQKHIREQYSHGWHRTGGSRVVMLAASVNGIVPAVTEASGYERMSATVVEAVVEESQNDRDYYPVVVYEYEFDGDNFYTGSTEPPCSESKARDRISEYESGENATVFVDPDDPDRAFLERRPPAAGRTGPRRGRVRRRHPDRGIAARRWWETRRLGPPLDGRVTEFRRTDDRGVLTNGYGSRRRPQSLAEGSSSCRHDRPLDRRICTGDRRVRRLPPAPGFQQGGRHPAG
ncbi:DUF3592 domain-containing protein [Halorientalis pallida]|uniref:DUF3592 domain-containing protein n=1 Tax=Halorientalis pallida TaxID=2479928 RepID=A0A498KWL1_9EURY|nr:DUF3592 domain-containing protein [Halorientalis pallida]